jgi:L-rhamnose mutarotase
MGAFDSHFQLCQSPPVPPESSRPYHTVLTTDLKPDEAAIALYREHHQHVWPEVLSSLRRAGIRHMEIFILRRRLVMIVETDGRDIYECFAEHSASGPRVAEWEALMQSLQAPPEGGRPEGWWTAMEPIFRLDQADER